MIDRQQREQINLGKWGIYYVLFGRLATRLPYFSQLNSPAFISNFSGPR